MTKCAECRLEISLVPVGTGWKWVTNPSRPKETWHCGNDPAYPVKTHAPRSNKHDFVRNEDVPGHVLCEECGHGRHHPWHED